MNITKAYIRHYSDNGQTFAYVEWSDGSRTEGRLPAREKATAEHTSIYLFGLHMGALLERAQHDGLTITRERW